MKIILCQKTGSDTSRLIPAIFNVKSSEQILEQIFTAGTITLIRQSDFPDFSPFMEHKDVLNCGIKKAKVELFRALKLNRRVDKDVPRRIIAGFASQAAFNRSFNKLMRHRYNEGDAPCLLFINNERLDELEDSLVKKSRKRSFSDPVSLLLEGIPDVEVMKRIASVYIGKSSEMRVAHSMIYRASRSVAPVLILGESGTGKELIAKQIYEHSTRYNKGLYVVNCSSIPDTLIESEMFGHVKGSFTGATSNKKGLFETANKGTLFLDEIGDLSSANQAKLLRAIENSEIRPVGSTKTIRVDVRIIAATNRNLHTMMKQKAFREDLFYRLNQLTVLAPALREIPDDIPEIAAALWKALGKSKKLSAEFLNYLKSYSWPGNVRELKTLLNSISDLFETDTPGPEHVEALRSYQLKTLVNSRDNGGEDFDKLLRAQCKSRIIEVQNILRGIKIEMRPVINKLESGYNIKKLNKLRTFVVEETSRLEDLCREPIFFKNRELFNHIKRFRYLLEKTMSHSPVTADELRRLWQSDLNPLHESIDREIFEIIWGKMDF